MDSVRRLFSAPVCVVAVIVAVAIGGYRVSNHPNSDHASLSMASFEGRSERALNAFGNLPLTFVENRGQTDPRVRFYAQGPRFTFHLTSDEVVLSLIKDTHAGASTRRAPVTPVAVKELEQQETERAVLGLRFLGSNPRVVVEGHERSPGQVNYFHGQDPSRWQTGLPSYAQVVYRQLWAGINLNVRAQAGSLKYEFQVKPGARVEDIQMAYTGSDGLSMDPAGALLIDTPFGVLRDSPPLAYQEIFGVRVPIKSSYVIRNVGSGGRSYGFELSAGYDPDHELIIDPGLEYSTYLGGASHEYGAGIAVDAAGNAYVMGLTQSPDFPTRAGSFDRTGAASNNLEVFVSKLNSTGTALIYSTFLGGSNFEWGRGMALDAAGNVYIAGQTKSSDFPTTGGAFDRTFNVDICPRCGIDQYDAFVTKLNATGSGLVYSTFLGGFDLDDAIGIAVDAAGNAYVTGETWSLNFPTTPGAFDTTRNGAFDAFLTKLNASGSALVYSTYLGGLEVDFGGRVAVDRDGSNNVYVLGSTRSADFPTTPGAFNTTISGAFDIFVTKVNATGSTLLYSTFLGGLDMDGASGLAIDFAGNAIIAGGTASANFPTTPGSFSTVMNGSSDAFVTKINPSGSTLVFSTFLGGSQSESVSDIVVDAQGNIYAAGGTGSADFPVTPGAFDTTFNGGSSDVFVAELNATGSALIYSTFLGGTNSEGASAIARGTDGALYLTGQTLSSDFPTTAGALDRVFNGDLLIFWADAFVTKLTLGTAPPSPPAISSVSANPASVVGGNGSTGTVALTSGAPSGGAAVSLSSTNAAVASLPASVTVPAGSLSARFPIATSTVATSTPVTITATYNSITKTATLDVTPVPPTTLQSLGANPAIVTGGATSQGTITLTGTAPAGGFGVTLSSSNAAASVPATVNVPQGATSATFSITTSAVTTSTPVTITANAGSVTRTASLTVTPAQSTSTLTVTATGRSGERVTSTPAGINVVVGTSGAASFTTGTSITLTISNNRDTVWSGACSSGGQKTKTCTFTLTANSTVTANVL